MREHVPRAGSTYVGVVAWDDGTLEILTQEDLVFDETSQSWHLIETEGPVPVRVLCWRYLTVTLGE